jgi:hypothetical protein
MQKVFDAKNKRVVGVETHYCSLPNPWRAESNTCKRAVFSSFFQWDWKAIKVGSCWAKSSDYSNLPMHD